MIKTRLVGLLSHAKKYIVYTILWQWLALLSQVFAVFSIANLMERVVYRAVNGAEHWADGGHAGDCDRVAVCLWANGSKVFLSGLCGCKTHFKGKNLWKNAETWASYSEQVSSSEVVQVSTEGVEQLETYFGKYLPQLFYSLIAPVTPIYYFVAESA